MSVKRITSDGHLQLVERILHDIVGIQLIDLAHHGIHVLHQRVGEEKELGPGQGLEAGQAKLVGFKHLDSSLWYSGVRGRVRSRGRGCAGAAATADGDLRGERACDGMDT